MATNIHLSARTAADIDREVVKVLAGLGLSGPPVPTRQVLDSLKLARRGFSINADGALREVVERACAGKPKVSADRVFERVKSAQLRGLYLADHREVLVDDELPSLKQRWVEGHEAVHHILPWHGRMLFGDTKLTLSPSCHESIEAEANFGVGRLLSWAMSFANILMPIDPP